MKIRGFTLIELMIAVLIVGILASIAYPSYRDHVVKARRADGKTALMDLASRMEQFYSENHTYAGATLGTGNTSDVSGSNQSPDGWYQLAITNNNAQGFTLTATPQNAQGAQDNRCQTLTLNNLGVQGIANGPLGAPLGTAQECW